MPEGLKFESTPKPYPSEGKLLINGMLEQLGISRDQFIKLPADEKEKIIEQVRETLRQPEISEILGQREEEGLSAETAQKIRDAFGGEKWNKLSEIVSYVKTLLGEKTVEERKDIFAKHLAFGVDANEIQHTLTRIHDVMPARIDTDIKHQSSMFYRAVVEVASNALDASIKHRSPIGRFGVGFYQILNHLKDPKDKVVVRTKSADSPVGIKIEFRNKNEEIVLKVSEDKTVTDQGTTVELSSKEFEADKAEKIIREYFSHTQDAELIINGKQLDRWKPDGGAETPKDLPTIDIKIEDGKCTVTDKGIGMPPRVIFEKLLVPKLSEKPPIYELKERGKTSPKIYFERSHSDKEEVGEIIIQVGGIVIEKEECRGVRVASTLVIDLPPSTILGEQRDEVEVNGDTVEAMKDAVDQAMKLPRPQCFEVINTLGLACRKLQNRSKLYGPGDNVFVYLQERVKETYPDLSFLPNKKEFLELDIDQEKVAFLDSSIYQTPLRSIHGLKEVRAWNSQEGVPLFEAKFKEGSTYGIISHENLIIVDERSNVTENPEIATKALELAVGNGKGKIITEAGMQEKEREIKSFETLEDLVSEQWRDFSFKSKEIALRQVELYERKNPEVTNAFTKKIFNQLHTVGAMEAWDALHWYVNADPRDKETQLKEIDQLSTNLSLFFSNPKVSEIIQTNKVPVLSMFEKFSPNTPEHIRANNGFQKRQVIINGETYYFNKSERGYSSQNDWGSGQIDCFSENGKTIRLYSYNQLYRDENITVYKDKIEDTKTGEIIEITPPIETPLGTIVFNNGSNKGAIRFSFVESGICKYINGHQERNEKTIKRNWDIRTEEGNQVVYIDGVKEANLSQILEKAQIPKGCELANIIKTKEGDIRLTFSNAHEVNNGYYLNYGYDRRKNTEEQNLDKEAFYIVDQNGEVIWQLNESEWENKIYPDDVDKFKREGRGEIELLEETRRMAARCMLIQHEGLTAEDDPVVKIVRYNFNGRNRIREVVGYVTASGEVVHTGDTDKINETTLDAKYAWESSCTCCQVDVGFHKASYSPFDKREMPEPSTGNFVELPVTIIGEFKFDESRREWLALSRLNEGSGEFNIHMAVFDEKGKFLHSEEIGYMPEIINGEYDWRNLKEYLPHRLPDRLNDVDTKDRDKSYWSYEQQIKNFVTFDHGVILNRRIPEYYGSKYIPDLQEVDNTARGLFDLAKGELTPDHMKALEKFLLKYPVPDREKLERVTYRLMEFRHLSPEDAEVCLPVFYEAESISSGFFTPRMMELLRTVSHLDSERFVQLFTMMYNSLPEDETEKEKIAVKIIKFYKEKLQSESLENAQAMVDELSNVRAYKNAIRCDGFTLIKHNVSIPPAEIPRNIRPFLTFIQSEEDELAYRETEGLKIPETQPQTVRLSEIIQWKRLRESEAKSFTEQDMLEEAVHKVTHGKTREHIVREITHAVHFQALNSTDLYVRELIQNAVDVMQGESMAKEDRNIEITTSATDSNELITHFQDPIGMDIKTVLNYFLVPGESTKTDRSKNFIGFYGQGVYTLFKNFKEINIKTSVGDGTVCYLTMKPVIEHDMVSDVSIDFRSAEEQFKGTVISKTQAAENPYVEAAYVKDAVMTLTSALSDDRASVVYQKEKVNSEYKVLAKSNAAELGEVTIYRNPNNIISQYGLYVKDIGSEYMNLVPSFMSESLKKWGGIAIDLPKGVELTRSRQDIASKDKVADSLNPQIQRNLVSGYFESFKEKMVSGHASFPFESLPYDYFFEGERYTVPSHYKEDAEALIKGEPLQHLDEYVNQSNALKLMTALPLFEVKDQPVSLDSIRKAFISDKKVAPFDQEGWETDLPRRLVELMKEQREQRSSAQAQKEEAKKDAIADNTLVGVYEKAPEELKKWITENKEDLQSLGVLTQVFIDTIDEVFRGTKRTRGLFHYSKTGEIAHARRGGDMSWNLAQMKESKWGSPLEEIKKYNGREGGKMTNLLNPISIAAHEYGHVIEDQTGWTHDPKHDKEQARVLLQFLIQNGPKKLLEALNPVMI